MEEELFLQASDNFVNSNYNTAIELFTKIINTNTDTNKTNYFHRACAYIAVKKYTEALEDLNISEESAPSNFEVLYKKGIALFYVEKFEVSAEYFKKALLNTSTPEQREKLVTWMNKVEIELDEINSNNSNNLNTENNNTNTDNTPIKLIPNWFQNATHITLTISSNTPLNNPTISLEKKSVKIFHNNSTIFEMNLSNSIVPLESTYKISARKIDIELKKEIRDFNWVTLERTIGIDNSQQQAYPTSAKVKKNWDNIEREICDELKNDEKNDPNAGMMRLFKEIYGNSTEETRRAMVKSFQTSGGTVLSTNWDEVEGKDYEGKDRPDAPKGQEWRDSKEEV